ncbi:polysaccharide deacetylase family protein [Pseudonocardia sp. DLS-67]
MVRRRNETLQGPRRDVRDKPRDSTGMTHRQRGGTSRRAALRAAALLPLAAACSTTPFAPPAEAPVAPTSTSTPAPPTEARAAAPREVERADTGRPEVALTFHGAGDIELARRVLTTLHDHGAAATVLAVGTWLHQYPDAARIVTDLGHEIGNHTWSHRNIDELEDNAAMAEIERCRDSIVAATGRPGAFFRPSQAQHATPTVRALAAAAGYPVVLSYDVDSRDWTDPGPAAIRHNVAAAGAGSVVSMHLGHQGTLTALAGVIADLADRGLTPVTATTLFT